MSARTGRWVLRRRRDERGSITPFVVIVLLGILGLAGLVVDGGRQLNAHGRAIAYAEEAARAGAQEIDVTDPNLGLNVTNALKAAREYCAQARAQDAELVRCEASAPPDEDGKVTGVRVDTEVDLRAILLGIVGKHELQAGGTALARPVSGITKADETKVATIPPPDVGAPVGQDTNGDGIPDPVSTAPPTAPTISVSPCTTEKPPTETPTDKATDKPTKSAEPSETPSQCVTNPG